MKIWGNEEIRRWGHVEMKILRMNDYEFEIFTKYCRKKEKKKRR